MKGSKFNTELHGKQFSNPRIKFAGIFWDNGEKNAIS